MASDGAIWTNGFQQSPSLRRRYNSQTSARSSKNASHQTKTCGILKFELRRPVLLIQKQIEVLFSRTT